MLKIKAPENNEVFGELEIPASKSISNRSLIIKALCKENIILENLSVSDDTITLQKAISDVNRSNKNEKLEINIGLAGTAFRFLTAYLATQKGSFVLTGEHRIKERPIKPLVDALISLGADIEYIEKEGYAPLLIKGKPLKGKLIKIDASISSQFITALLLISPRIKDGLHLKLNGKISSQPYINMTLSLMKHFGLKSSFIKKEIIIKEQTYLSKKLFIEADWSSASYLYQTLALADKGNLKLLNYSKHSLQGDSKTAQLFEQFGVETKFNNDSIELTKHSVGNTTKFKYDFSNEPDLAQTFIALCVGLNKEAQVTGLESLKIKETNRIEALDNEIKKLGWELKETQNGVFFLEKSTSINTEKAVTFETYKDHRMAMCLAPLSLKFGILNVENPQVVSKSNPLFWEQLKRLGFEIEII